MTVNSVTELCAKWGLEKAWVSVPAGWLPLVDRTMERLSHLGCWSPSSITQVKEKFGMLRIYTSKDLSVDMAWAIITEAEDESGRTCESCGGSGRLRTTGQGFHYAACDNHILGVDIDSIPYNH